MNKPAFKWLVILLALFGVAALVFAAMPVSGFPSNSGEYQVTPNPTPTPTTPPETSKALEYIAAREGIPVENLVVTSAYRWEFIDLGKAFWMVTALEKVKGGGWYTVMIDLSDGSFVDDPQAVLRAEDQAHFAKYGKLEPALFERLATLQADDTLPVAVWIAGSPRRSQEDLYAELAAKYPQAGEALERSGKPFDVADHDLMMQIKAEYMRLLGEDTQAQAQPLADFLQAKGYAVTVFEAMPALSAILPKSLILELASRSDVGAIYLIEEKVKVEVDTAVPSDRVPVVWQSGFKGSGVGIAILEPGKVDFTGPQPGQDNYLHQGQARLCSQGVSDHKTWVASIAASYHSTYTGVAPEATIHDACTDGSQDDTVLGLSWAVDRADIVNASFGFEANGQMNFSDKAFDHYARNGNALITKSAGNRINCGSNMRITSPGNGWNVMAVGASNHNENSDWSDDGMWVDSCWVNPVGTDREKPEVVGPGFNIKAITSNRNFMEESGTSAAAPQVAGLAALLIDRNGQLSAWPEAIRAIIMASAVNNVDGPSDIPTGLDLLDGAGAIDAALADSIAKTRSLSSVIPCDGPCWWGLGINNSNFPVGTYLNRFFNVVTGERVRVAISWWSNVDCPSQSACNFDRLDTGLNLAVFDPEGYMVAYSASSQNNYELVEFTAAATGTYNIAVLKAWANEDSNYLGIAWAKDATYLPDLRNKYGWASWIYLRNDGTQARVVPIDIFQQTGDHTTHNECSLEPNQWCWIPVNEYDRLPPETTGTAVIGGGEDVTVLVENVKTEARTNYVGFLSSGQSGNPDWDHVGSTLYLPTLKYDWSGRVTTLTMMNTGPSSTTITVSYYDSNGVLRGTSTCGTLILQQCVIQTPYLGANYRLLAGRITNSMNYPLAVVITERDLATSTQISTYQAIGKAATKLYAPLIKKNYYNQDTGIRIYNPSASAADITVTYYEGQSPYRIFTNHVGSLGQNASTTLFEDAILPDNFLGSAVIESSQPVVAEMHESGAVRKMASNVFQATGSKLSFAVRICQNCSEGYSTGLRMMNIGSAAANIVINYYDDSGGRVGPPEPINGLAQYRAINASLIPAGLNGSAVITSDQPIVTIVNLANPDITHDWVMTYSAPNR